MEEREFPSDKMVRLTDACVAVIARDGVAGATSAAVARQAGVPAGLIHYYFGPKSHLLAAAVRRIGRAAQDRTEARLAGATTVEERLQAWIEARLGAGDSARPDHLAAWVALQALSAHDSAVQDALSDQAAADVGRLMALGADRTLASGLVALVSGLYSLDATSRAWSVPPGSAVDVAMALVRGWRSR